MVDVDGNDAYRNNADNDNTTKTRDNLISDEWEKLYAI